MTTPAGMADAAPAFFDVIVVGAGISGIAAGHYLQTLCPGRTYTILEGRQAIGGTWDLFRYPGVRSDSDMFTLGYSFRPWDSDTSFATGPVIRDYVVATASEEGIDSHIRFGHRATSADWNSAEARWNVVAATAHGELRLSCRFLFFCSGYYDYTQGHEPQWAGRESFGGRVVHPQQWPGDLDFAGRRVVVIGSGATAVTLVPALAATAAHVTMLQRSPSYIVALPGRDRIGAGLRRALPPALAYRLVRWKNVLLTTAFYQYARRRPEPVRAMLLKAAGRLLGSAFDIKRHFSPTYKPWDQRLCIAPDADLFLALRSGKASIVTDTIERFTPGGIRLASGAELPADIVVTATGLALKLLGGAHLRIDGAPVELSNTIVYRGAMYSGIPNMAVASGYTNASWTLKCELVARYVCRVLNHMQARGLDSVVPVPNTDAAASTEPFLNLSSGYVQRAAPLLPRQGDRMPWRMVQNYLFDLLSLRFSSLRDGILRFERVSRRDSA